MKPKRLMALLLVIAMCLSLFPVSASAAETTAEVWLSYQDDGYILAKQTAIVSSELADNYGYTDGATGCALLRQDGLRFRHSGG